MILIEIIIFQCQLISPLKRSSAYIYYHNFYLKRPEKGKREGEVESAMYCQRQIERRYSPFHLPIPIASSTSFSDTCISSGLNLTIRTQNSI